MGAKQMNPEFMNPILDTKQMSPESINSKNFFRKNPEPVYPLVSSSGFMDYHNFELGIRYLGF